MAGLAPSWRNDGKALVALLLSALGDQGQRDVAWSEAILAPESPEDFAQEAIYVICNSGMKHTIARRIYEKVAGALANGDPAGSVFGHAGKATAIDFIWRHRAYLFSRFRELTTDDARLDWLGATLPWIGDITKFHLAKNFGVDCVKPDVHLVRLADAWATTPDELCSTLAAAAGYRKATIDLILWRACATGVLDSRTGVVGLAA